MLRPAALILILLAASCTSSGETAAPGPTTTTVVETRSTIDSGTMTEGELAAAWDDVLAAEELTVTFQSLQVWPGEDSREVRTVWTRRGDHSHSTTNVVSIFPDFIDPPATGPPELITRTSTATRYASDERLLVRRADLFSPPFGAIESTGFVDLGGAGPLRQTIGFGAMLDLPYGQSLNISSAERIDSLDSNDRYRIEVISLPPRIFVVNSDRQIVAVESPSADPSDEVVDEIELTIERSIDASLLEPLDDAVIVSFADALDGVDDSGNVPVSTAAIEASITALSEAPELTIDLELAGPVDQTASFSWIIDRDGTSAVRTNLSDVAADAFSSPAFEDAFASPPADDEESDRGMAAAFAVEYLSNIAAPIECRWNATDAVLSGESLNEAAQSTVAWYDSSGVGDEWDFDFVQPFRTLRIDQPWIATRLNSYACRTFEGESRGLLPDVRDELDVVWLGSNGGVHRVAVFESLENPSPYIEGFLGRAWVLAVDETGQIHSSTNVRTGGPIGALFEDGWTSTLNISYDNTETIVMPPSSEVVSIGG